MFSFEEGFEFELECKLDGFTCGSRWRNDDYSAGGRFGLAERFRIWR